MCLNTVLKTAIWSGRLVFGSLHTCNQLLWVWKFTHCSSSPTSAQFASTSGTPPGRKSLVDYVMVITSRGNAESSCLMSHPGSRTRTFLIGIVILSESAKTSLLSCVETKLTSRFVGCAAPPVIPASQPSSANDMSLTTSFS